ncbi:helix-turn-helix domain-containing protein [Thermoactinospora rubra]|uniref:helix-turn-helix domain-containing protein n=1 Tax=Thermoactinospora rubra TaxID=1088767 RepID=UPI000A0F4D34|nr:helix-turn-helix transcriptional regulator [Thermoactinospora rubra]
MRQTLTITFGLDTDKSVEQAIQLIERWLADELAVEQWLRPLKVSSVMFEAEGLPIPDSGLKLARRRKALHLTQAELAERAGISRRALSKVERGELTLASDSAIRIRRALTELEAGR